jgi:hypothetical protein
MRGPSVDVEAESTEDATTGMLTGAEAQRLHALHGLSDAPAPELPRLDDDGLLWFGRRWVAVSDSQLTVVAYLLDRPNQLVRTDAIRSTYVSAGRSGHPRSVGAMLARVKRRFAAVGITLHAGHSKGVFLELPTG